MEDPIGGHPTRAEQLDILVSAADAVLQPGDALLDLGCGTGYLAHLLFRRRDDVAFVGLDRKGESLQAARDRFGDRARFVEGDLGDIGAIDVAGGPFKVIATALTFHDLDDGAKRSVIAWAAERLAPGGVFLLYDRLRLTAPSTFRLQQAVWDRIEKIHGRPMRTAASFADYEADLSPSNRPARLDDYSRWFTELGLEHQILHLHGNVALIAAAKGETTP
ncbi:class I SAM-dependent methyltransferase [Thalassobaculum litoreum]|uniref:Methyltransferase domain-containing protein n=1 Tax=Thalassobaculum litoreum DSM 18839 TaxID=1123362 RepID=A0A8G2BG47_9PROT|nr:class I SAM-dependent methyltransferase [Thalassobaculum litoreum]SDF38291.1 Methyltransferase domain-containing protein [Thalassobaculum litoreum DSM 18839]